MQRYIHHPRPAPKNRDRGFTLIELVIVIIITGIIAALGSKMLSAGFNAYLTGRDILRADWQGMIALERISRELRFVRTASAADLNISSPQKITFTDNNAKVISYSLQGSTLMRNSQPLADGISRLNFSYIATDGKTTARNSSEVGYITVNLVAAGNSSGQSLRSTVHPRNFQ